MISEDVQDYIKAGVAFAPPGLSAFGVSLQDWMYIISMAAGALLILERLPRVFRLIRKAYEWVKK